MSETNINLGPVSAYALAKTKGYTGTEAEFAQLMANYATVGQQAAQSAAIASTAANTANTKASEAATSANNAATSATNASRSATAASQSATAASNSASSAATSAQTANAKSTEATNSANAASQSAGSASQYSQQALTARNAAQAAQTAAESAKTAAEAAAAESRADYTTLNTKVDNTKTALEAEIDAVSDDVADLDTAVQSKASTTALQAETARATAEEARIEALFTAPTEEAVADWLEAHPEATTTVQDGAISYAKLDSTLKEKADTVDDLKSSLYGFNADTKSALLALLEKVAYVVDDGQELYDALEDALYPPLDVDYITAVYTQSGTVYNTDTLNSLKSDLVVTAHYSDGTSGVVTAYTLSGTLEAGTSTITVSYSGKTASFNVTVTEIAPLWTFTNGYTAMKATSGAANGYTFRGTAAARACGHDPIANEGYVFTVTDSSKYNLAVYGISNLEKHALTYSGSVDGYGYANGTNSPSWVTSGYCSDPYVWLALKKMDGTAFTDAELANGAAAVFTYTKE